MPLGACHIIYVNAEAMVTDHRGRSGKQLFIVATQAPEIIKPRDGSLHNLPDFQRDKSRCAMIRLNTLQEKNYTRLTSLGRF